jgi:uncharacterized protein
MEVSAEILFTQLMAVILAASFGLFVSRIAWKKGFFTLPAKEPIGNDILLGKIALQAFALFLTIQILFVPFVYAFWVFLNSGHWGDFSSVKLTPETEALGNLVVISTTAFALMAFFFSLSKKARDAIWGSSPEIRRGKNLRDFAMGSLTWWLAYPWVLMIGQIVAIGIAFFYSGPLPDQLPVKHLKSLAPYPMLLGLMFIVVTTIVPFLEELLFRGFLQSWLKAVMNRTVAIFLTAVIFAAFHFSSSQGVENIEFVLSLFCFSCFLGFIKERQQSLWASIGLHATFNFVSVLMLLSELNS